MESNHGDAEMIDHTDTQTQQLPLEVKRSRGRPKTGTALTAAQKQKAYRERNKGNVTDNSAEIEALKAEIEELKIALGKEVIARKKAEERAILVTQKSDQNSQGKEWIIEFLPAGKRKLIMTAENDKFTTEEKALRRMKHYQTQKPGLKMRVKESLA